jgi:hypothetical protein
MGKISIVLAVAALVLSAFNLTLMFRNNTVAPTVTAKRIQCDAYGIDSYIIIHYRGYPFFNVTATIQWQNGTITVVDLENCWMENAQQLYYSLPFRLNQGNYTLSVSAVVLQVS